MHQVGFSLHDYIEIHGQGNIKHKMYYKYFIVSLFQIFRLDLTSIFLTGNSPSVVACGRMEGEVCN